MLTSVMCCVERNMLKVVLWWASAACVDLHSVMPSVLECGWIISSGLDIQSAVRKLPLNLSDNYLVL